MRISTKKIYLVIVAVLTAVMLMAASAPAEQVRAVEGVVFLADESSSTDKAERLTGCNEMDKIALEKAVMSKINQALPDYFMAGAMRIFGEHMDVTYADEFSRNVWGPDVYTQSAVAEEIDALQPNIGLTPLGPALANTDKELSGLPGNKALLVFSDFKESPSFGDPEQEALKLRAKYGDDLRIYSIVLTSDEARRTRADRIALGGGVYDACTLINSQSALNGFIQEVFWTTVEPDVTDSDMDGIYDAMDECPGTPAEVANTMNGCWKGAYTVFFEFNQSDIQNMYEPYVREAARLLREHPDLMVSIEGHADAVGTESYNEGLAMERSQAVKDMLVANGVSAARLDAGEASENQPVAPNDSSAFRELNRRVELILWQPGYNE